MFLGTFGTEKPSHWLVKCGFDLQDCNSFSDPNGVMELETRIDGNK
jgi:hypothetical protein